MASWHQPSDTSFLLSVLKDGRKHSTNEIIQASLAERGVGLTVHSRAATLRAQGHNVICESGPRRNGRATYYYRLATLRESSQSGSSFGDDDPQHASLDAGRDDSRRADTPSTSGAAPVSPEAAPDQLSLPLPGGVFKSERAA